MSTPVTTATFDDTGGQVYVDPKLPTLIINQSATVTVTLSPTQGFDAIQSGQTVAGTQQVMLLQPLAAVTWSPGTPCYAKTPAGTTANITSVPGGMSYYGASSIISGGQVDVTVQNTPNVVVEGGTVDVGTMPDVTFTNSSIDVSGTVDANITNSSVTVDASGSTISLASGTAVALEAGTATIGTVDLAAGSSVDANISGPVTIETASGTPITANVQGSLTSIADPISVSGPVTIEGTSGGTAVGVAGTVDANITNASITVETSGTTDVNVTNATVPVSGSVTATVDGPVGISGGTINVIQPFTGETAASSVGATTTGNATLSTTDYNLVSWPAVPLPAGSPGNLVYDSNLENAIAAVGPTWSLNGGTIGTADGDFNVTNPGTDSAEWVQYGTGSIPANYLSTVPIDVTPGAVYTLSAVIDATNQSTGGSQVQVASVGNATNYLSVEQGGGLSGLVAGSVTIPAGVTQVQVNCWAGPNAVTAGDTISWSYISLVEGPAPANLVFDSELVAATASANPSWVGSGVTIGTANGDWNVVSAGTDSAKWVYYGTGAAASGDAESSQPIAVTPGATYTLSAYMDATHATTGDIFLICYYGGSFGNLLKGLNGATGTAGLVSAQITIPSGVTSVQIAPEVGLYGNTTIVAAGETVSWSQIQLTETSTIQPYAPGIQVQAGPLWEYPVYGRGGLLGETTALAFEDTGGSVNTDFQPPAINTSYPQLASPSAPTVTPEGTTGSTDYSYQVSAKTAGTSVGATRLAPSPGTKIGTIDIGPGNTVEIAAGTAQIGTVDIASGATITLDASSETIGTVELATGTTVDANITNATLDISGPVTVSGGQLATSGGIALQPTSEQLNPSWLGDGSDGAVTISGTVSLTRDMQYSSLSVPSGTVLNTNGWRIRATGPVTIDGTLTNAGGDGVATTTTAVGGSGGSGNSLPGGGTGGAAFVSGNSSPMVGAGNAGDNGQACSYGGGDGGSASYDINGTVTSFSGGDSEGSSPIPAVFPTIGQMTNGSIGGGGGGAGASAGQGSSSSSNPGAGAGGGGGGCILLLCNGLYGGGTIDCSGGDGASLASGIDIYSTASGGGGGGGMAIVLCFTNSFTGTFNVSGGTGSSTGSAAANGQEGFAYILDGMQW